MSNSRRVYISSVDNITPDPKFSTIELNLANARLERKSHQRLSVALVKASFPAEMGAGVGFKKKGVTLQPNEGRGVCGRGYFWS